MLYMPHNALFHVTHFWQKGDLDNAISHTFFLSLFSRDSHFTYLSFDVLILVKHYWDIMITIILVIITSVAA